MRHQRFFAIGILIIITTFAVYKAFDNGILRLNYPSTKRFPIQGLDVSHHQGNIDWENVGKQKDIRFVFIKATEGVSFKDPKFSENWENSKKAGILRGAYHFFTFCRSGKEQARNFLSLLASHAPDKLPIAIDLELAGKCSTEVSREALIVEINAFLDETKKIYPQKPIFYVTNEFFNRYMKNNISQFPSHYLWLRNIYYEPSQEKCEHWSIWQFANRGIIDGISTPVDLNVVCMEESTLVNLFK